MQDQSGDWYGPEAATFGDRLAAAREQAGMTQEQLAKRLGVKPGSVKKWEADMLEPRANRLSILAGLLNVSMSWLLNGQGNGVAHDDSDDALSPDLNDLLIEIREMKTVMSSQAEKLGRLEKRLRLSMAEAAE